MFKRTIKSSYYQIIIPAACLLLGGCRSFSDSAVLLEVPFVKQEGEYCGSDALAMVMRYYGSDADVNAVRERVHIPVLKGTTPGMLVHCAPDFGFAAELVRGSREKLFEWIEAGLPPILFVLEDDDNGIGHFLVVTGLDAERNLAIVHTGARSDLKRDLGNLLEAWARGRYSAILVRKPVTK